GQGDGDRPVAAAEVVELALGGRGRRLSEKEERAEIEPLGAENTPVRLKLQVHVGEAEVDRPWPRGHLRASFEVMGFGYTHRLSPNRLLPRGIKSLFGETIANHPAVGPPWAQGGQSEV